MCIAVWVSEVCPGSMFSVSYGSWVHGEMHPLQEQSYGLWFLLIYYAFWWLKYLYKNITSFSLSIMFGPPAASLLNVSGDNNIMRLTSIIQTTISCTTEVRCGCYAVIALSLWNMHHKWFMKLNPNLSILDVMSQVLFLGFKLYTITEICTDYLVQNNRLKFQTHWPCSPSAGQGQQSFLV